MKKKTMLDKLLDVIYPPVCMFCKNPISGSAEPVCADCTSRLPFTKNNGCFEAFGDTLYLISPLFYSGGVKRAVRDLKFKSKYSNADILAAYMTGYISSVPQAMSADIVIPVPLSEKSYIKRGFNQSALLARGICDRSGLTLGEGILIKTRETKRQSSLDSFDDRAKNVLGAFACTEALSDMTVLLVDDIYTTGMTIYNCAKALKAAGASEIIAATAAYAHRETGYSTHDYNGSRLVFPK